MSFAGLITRYLDTVLGLIFLLVLAFFVMQIVLAAISLATDFDNSTKSYESAVKQLTAAIKGLAISFLVFFLLNTILFVLGINTSTETITQTLGNQFNSLFTCLRDFRGCNSQ